MTGTARAGDVTAVLIVGAGPTGLTLACELARRGVAFRLIDAAAGAQTGSRGKGVQPRTLEVFGDLRILDRVLDHGRLAMPIRSTAPDGQVTVGGSAPESLRNRPDIPFATSLITPEWRVEEALRRRLDQLGGGVEFGTALDSFEQTADGVSAVVTREGRPTTIDADWLVGCDGGHSVARSRAGIAFVGETRESVRMIVADVEVDGLGHDAWQMWRHEDGLLSLCPLPSTSLFQYQAGIAPGQNPDLSVANMQDILERRSGRSGRSDIRLAEPTWRSLWRANVRLVERYREGRVLLAGDAAHIHSPAGGQGMNTGIQDAYNLGWKLAAVVQGARPELLDTYEAERRPVAAGVLALSDARLKQTLEQNAVPIERTVDATQLGVNYRGSVLARDDRNDDATLRAGDRAPDATRLATLDGEHRLFDLIRSGEFTILDFGDRQGSPRTGSDALRTLRVVRRVDGPGQVRDVEGILERAYGASERTMILLRPDGYIAAISDAGDQGLLDDHLVAVVGRPRP